ncbi:hypothetical protein C8R47DRAFT_1230238 [Mycena vitilis]|nr:hypothetical protein C8R47DRAFT_1230238 [Mycena vitilis]
MKNYLQYMPSTPAAQFYAPPVSHPAAPLFSPRSPLLFLSQPALAASQPAVALDPRTLYFYRGSGTPHSALASYQQVECLDAPTPDDQLPERRTCPMPYHPATSTLGVPQTGDAGKKLYVVCPGRIQGLYDDDKKADANVKKWRNGRGISVHRWTDGEREWAMCCLRWHGEVCPNARPRVTMDTRVVLNPALLVDNVPVQWAVKGMADFFPSRECAFAAANAKDLQEIHVLGTKDEAALQAFTGIPA